MVFELDIPVSKNQIVDDRIIFLIYIESFFFHEWIFIVFWWNVSFLNSSLGHPTQ
jgi:hypothetical protein